YLSQIEIEGVTLISVTGMLIDTCGENSKIADLSGIEYFTSCKRLRCGGIGLTNLDVSKMPQLVELTCAGNELTSLDISGNTNLEWLNCSSNSLSAINVSNNARLTRLDCYVNNMASIDVSMLPALTILRCQRNQLTEIDLSSNTALTTLNCSDNHLTELDLSANTALTTATDSFIGNQTTDASARIENSSIFVAFSLKSPSKIVSTSVDRIENVGGVDTTVLGYDGIDFEPQCIDDIVNGIDYYYDTGLENAENMSVHVDVQRDFYQVKFYTDENKQSLFGTSIVSTGTAAAEPEITDIPQCKKFAGWSENISNITSDMEVYAVWEDAHNLKITGFSEGIVSVECTNCTNENAQYVFANMVNARKGSAKYVQIIDINSDGIINAKDYARLIKMFK
ncbi:MAG: leucine-rich repeat domain-containing protein, partial [Eubacterium sp.]